MLDVFAQSSDLENAENTRRAANLTEEDAVAPPNQGRADDWLLLGTPGGHVTARDGRARP